MRRKNPLFGNENGLPGLPKTTYVTVGGRRVQPSPQPPRTQMRTSYPPPQNPVPTRQPPLTRQAPLTMAGPDPTLSRRIDALDRRINSTEQSNRTLLDELMRLQKDINVNVRKNEIGIQEERDSRSRLEMSIRQSQGRNYEVDDRIKRTEDGVKDNRGAIHQVSLHVNNIEKMASSLQQDQYDKKSDSSNKIQETRNEILQLTSNNEQLQRIVNNLREEARDNSNRIDTLSNEVATLSNNLRLQTKLMEENARKPVNIPVPKTPGGIDKQALESERANTEAKVMQLNSAIQDLSRRLSEESKSRDKADYDLSSKISSIAGDFNNTSSKNEKAQKEYDDKMKEMNMGLAETEKQAIKMEISKVANELNAKIDKNERNLRKDTVEKLNVIEKTLVDENNKRKEDELNLTKKVDQSLSQMKNNGQDENKEVQKAVNDQLKQTKENLNEINKRVTEVEKDFKEHKLQQEKVLHAEIDERLKNDKILDAKIEDLDDDVRLGFTKLQEDFGRATDELNNKKNSSKSPKTPVTKGMDYDEVERLQEENARNIRQQVALDLGKLQSRISKLEMELKQKDDIISNRLETAKNEDKESSSQVTEQLQQQIDALVLKHGKLKKQLDELETQVEDTPKNLQSLKEATNEKIDNLSKDVVKERKERKEMDDEFKEDIGSIIGSKTQGQLSSLAQLNLDVEQTQTGLKKCAESIHVVKTMLTDRLKDEKKIREKETAILNSDVERLDTKIKELKDRVKNSSNGGDYFPPAGDDDDDFL